MKVITETQYTSKLTIFNKHSILKERNAKVQYMEVVGNNMHQETSQSEQDADDDLDLVRRRATLEAAFHALPTYGSVAFWNIIEESQSKLALPLEVLVKCTRVAIAKEDHSGKNRIIEMIFRRIQQANEYWSHQVLHRVYLSPDEQCMFAHDLYADLCERIIRALFDSNRQFWEENFQHCLSFEWKHVYQAFMKREGRWYNQFERESHTRRIPRNLVDSFDQPVRHSNGELWKMDVEDEQAQHALLSVEQHDLPLIILNLPEKLKPVIWLIFWEGRTEKSVATILGVSDRTIRNRLHKALQLLLSMRPGCE